MEAQRVGTCDETTTTTWQYRWEKSGTLTCFAMGGGMACRCCCMGYRLGRSKGQYLAKEMSDGSP